MTFVVLQKAHMGGKFADAEAAIFQGPHDSNHAFYLEVFLYVHVYTKIITSSVLKVWMKILPKLSNIAQNISL